MGTIYVSVPVLPLHYQANLDNIFLTCLFHSSDLKKYGTRVLLTKLIDELNYLETVGIEVTLPEGTERIFFVVALVIGDNLGLNTILGFTESFSATYCCRFCKSPKIQMQHLIYENELVLRNIDNYLNDVCINDVRLTGIKEDSIWNDIKSFHVTQNMSVDIMHDLLEVICPYEIALILYQFIFIDQYFSLSVLNSKIEYFNYGEDCNKPPLISVDDIKNERLRMSASEMLVFIQKAGLIFGYLVPDGDKHWKLFLILREIMSIVTAKFVQYEAYHYLKILIADHHSIYLNLFNKPLKPKHHFMIHYPSVMKNIGPLALIWCMRFEAKHRELKQCANAVSSRVNITKTIALKQQLNVCHRFLCGKILNEKLELGQILTQHGASEPWSSIKEYLFLMPSVENLYI